VALPAKNHTKLKELPTPGPISLSLSLSYTYKDMGSMFSSSTKSKEELEMALKKAKEIVSSAPVVVFRLFFYLSPPETSVRQDMLSNIIKLLIFNT
jgi:hypothetical protein